MAQLKDLIVSGASRFIGPIYGTASNAITASNAVNAANATNATEAKHAGTAIYASSAGYAANAGSALSAGSAGYAAKAGATTGTLTIGGKTFNGSANVSVSASDLNISGAMHFVGTTTSALTDGATTNPVVVGGSNHTNAAGDVVLYSDKEFVWTGSAWELLGPESSYKTVQTAVNAPTANTGNAISFVDTLSQNANGNISYTTKTVPSASSTTAGLVTTGAQTIAGAKTFTGDMTVTKLTVTTAIGALSGTATRALHAASATFATNSTNSVNADYASEAAHAETADSAVDDTKVLKAGDTMSGTLYITKNGETGVEVNNTTRGHTVGFIVGDSGNGGLYDRTKSKWVVYSTTAGNVYLNGQANCATEALHATSAAWASVALNASSAGWATSTIFSMCSAFAIDSMTARYSVTAAWAITAQRANHASTSTWASSAAYAANANNANNAVYASSAAYTVTAGSINQKVFYGTCGTVTATAAKVVTCPDFGSEDLVKGAVVFVTFDYSNNQKVGDITLDVNGTGAKGIRHLYNNSITTIPAAAYLAGGQTYTFWYDGSYWVTLMDYNTDNVNRSTVTYPRLKTGAVGIGRYTLFMEASDGTYQSLTSTFNNTGTAHVKNAAKFKLGRIFYANRSSDIAANTIDNTSNSWMDLQTDLVDVRYSTNCAGTLTARAPFFIVGTVGTDGYFTLNDTWYSNAWPSSDDGNVYIYLGHVYNDTTPYRIAFETDNPVYVYKNGGIQLYSGYSQYTGQALSAGTAIYASSAGYTLNAASATWASSTPYAGSSTYATKAAQDASGNNIKDTYAASFSISDHTITLKNKTGNSLGTVTVPDNNTTYTFGGGSNCFYVTPSGGTTQTVGVTPYIANNITGSGTSGYLVKFNGANSIANGPAITSGGTGFLKQDGTWATPTNTTYANATTAAAGLMSAADKQKLLGIADNANNYSLPVASDTDLGGVKIGFSTNATSKNYAVQLSSEKMYVNVPWTDTTYGAGAGLSLSGTTFTNAGVRAVVTGSTNGTILVNTNGTTAEVAVKGLGSNAYNSTSYLPLGGGTMTGTLTAKANIYGDSYTGAINMNNSNIYNLNSIYTADASEGASEGFNFYRSATNVDTFWVADGAMYFVPNRALGTNTTTANSQSIGRFTAVPTTGQVVITDGVTGGIKSSGYTIAANVPSGAKFTDTTYSANNGVGLSGTTFYNSGVRSAGLSGNQLAVNTNGTTSAFTIPYATKAGSTTGTLTFGDQTFNGSEDVSISYGDLGLTSTLTFRGITTTALTNGATTSPINMKAGGTLTPAVGDMVMTETEEEFLYADGQWNKLGLASNYAVQNHWHGNIQNNGTISITATAANNDRILISDNSSSNKIVAGPAIGTDTTKYLRNDGSWAVPTNTTYDAATTAAAGLMSAADKTKLLTIATSANYFTYTLPTATGTTKGGVIIGSNISSSSNGAIYLTKSNVTTALGYTPPTTNTTYSFGNNNPTLSWGATAVIGYAGGTTYTAVMPANPNTHWQTKLIAGLSNSTANATATNGNLYLRLFDDAEARNSIKIAGTGATTVASDGSGNITINSSNTTYDIANTTTAGLIKPWAYHSKASTGPTVTSNATAVAVNALQTLANRYYAVEGDVNGRLFVNVPWSDNNTTYSAATTTTDGLLTSTLYNKLIGIATAANAYTYTLQAATSATLGGVRIGYTASGKNYPVQLNSNNQMYVNVPWVNDNTTSFTITANATDGLWDLTGTNGTNAVTYAVGAYSAKDSTNARFYTGTTNPTLTTRLNYDGYFYATKLYSGGSEVLTSHVRDPGYGQVTIGAAVTTATSITANTNTTTATSYNEKITINPGNKWIQLAATNSATSGSDSITIAHAAQGLSPTEYGSNTVDDEVPFTTGYTLSVPTFSVDEAGHITAISNTNLTMASPTALETNDIVSTDSGNFYVLGQADNTDNVKRAKLSATAGVYFTNEGRLYGAAWNNDFAECREIAPEIEPGRVVKENGDGSLSITTERLERGCEITSDTFGFLIGKTDVAKTPIAVSGRVLAYPNESISEFRSHIGWPVCSGPDGTVSIMTEEEELKYPSRIIGTISEIPTYETWGDIEVKGRVWIRVR